jgi:hypothetical protein
MASAADLLHGVTEGRGSYNRHAVSQAAGGAAALPLLRKAAQHVAVDPGDTPIVIADYGSSQGQNSLKPIRAAIAVLRARTTERRPICVTHVDVAENDFSMLFGMLDESSDSYLSGDDNIYPNAIGRSFYRAVLPPAHVHLGWSSHAAVWLSLAPTNILGHVWILASTGATRVAFERQAARDWEAFLRSRARELREGGRLVVVLPAALDDGTSPINAGMNHINAALAQMVTDRVITAEEYESMTLLSYPRRKSEVLAPFGQVGRFANLVLEQCEVVRVPDAAWADYEHDRDSNKLAAKHAAFFRVTFMPSLASALAAGRGVEGRGQFIDHLTDGLRRRLAVEPSPQHRLVQVIVLAKGADA